MQAFGRRTCTCTAPEALGAAVPLAERHLGDQRAPYVMAATVLVSAMAINKVLKHALLYFLFNGPVLHQQVHSAAAPKPLKANNDMRVVRKSSCEISPQPYLVRWGYRCAFTEFLSQLAGCLHWWANPEFKRAIRAQQIKGPCQGMFSGLSIYHRAVQSLNIAACVLLQLPANLASTATLQGCV